MGEPLLLLLGFAWNAAVTLFILRRDIGKLSGPLLARAWPDTSIWSAVMMFGFICLPIHFVRTRRSWGGAALGLVWLLCALVLIAGPLEFLAWIFGIPD